MSSTFEIARTYDRIAYSLTARGSEVVILNLKKYILPKKQLMLTKI